MRDIETIFEAVALGIFVATIGLFIAMVVEAVSA